MMSDLAPEKSVSEPEGQQDSVVNAILQALRGVRYGQVTIIVQDGKVIQIDRVERRGLTSS